MLTPFQARQLKETLESEQYTYATILTGVNLRVDLIEDDIHLEPDEANRIEGRWLTQINDLIVALNTARRILENPRKGK